MKHGPKPDSQIDALFQLPLSQFTEKRNALAKEMAGESKKQIKFLTKPPLPIWAVNQLYWNDKATYSALIDASEKLRTAHRAALSGQKADIPKAEKVHRGALDRAVARTFALLERSQEQVTDATRETVRKTLAALPNEEASGRLTRVPEAAGFSLLTGITGAWGAKGASGARRAAGAPGAPGAPGAVDTEARRKAAEAAAKAAAAQKAHEEKVAREREQVLAAAERELQQARKAAEQAKFKVRKLTVDLERAQAAEERLAGQVTIAEQKVKRLGNA